VGSSIFTRQYPMFFCPAKEAVPRSDTIKAGFILLSLSQAQPGTIFGSRYNRRPTAFNSLSLTGGFVLLSPLFWQLQIAL